MISSLRAEGLVNCCFANAAGFPQRHESISCERNLGSCRLTSRACQQQKIQLKKLEDQQDRFSVQQRQMNGNAMSESATLQFDSCHVGIRNQKSEVEKKSSKENLSKTVTWSDGGEAEGMRRVCWSCVDAMLMNTSCTVSASKNESPLRNGWRETKELKFNVGSEGKGM